MKALSLAAAALLAGATASADTTLIRPPEIIDRGELVARLPETLIRHDVVSLDPSQVVNDGRGAPELSLELFPDVELRATLNRFEQSSARTSQWHGRAVDDFASMVVLTVADDRLFGSVVYHGRRYAIAWLPSGNYGIAEIDLEALPPDDPRRSDVPVALEKQEAPAGFRFGKWLDSEVDLMILWSADISGYTACNLYSKLALGGMLDCVRYINSYPVDWKAIIEGVLIPHAIAESNFVFANSGLGTPLNVVHQQPVAYLGSGDLEEDLDRMTTVGDGVLEYVNAVRNAHEADLVMLITYESDPLLCGIAQGPPSISLANSMIAFGVVSAQCFLNGSFTFVHELGHLMGAQHDWYAFADLMIGGTGAPPKKYAHGYTQMVEGPMTIGLMTIMAYPNECLDKGGDLCARVPFFSDGGAWGKPESDPRPADNARMISEALSTIANYR